MAAIPQKPDWSARQYLKFHNERTRAVYDLISQIPALPSTSTPRLYDLGCGPGNSTTALHQAFPGAHITGMDSSPDMLRKARDTLPDVEFIQGDLNSFSLPSDEKADLLFSNAVFHWLRRGNRIRTITRLIEKGLKPNGVIAFQVPDNYLEPSHKAMRETATLPNHPWSKFFADAKVGNLTCLDRPDLDPIETPQEYYNALLPLCSSVNIWHTLYRHILASPKDIAEWVKGTGLQPYLNRIEDEGAKEGFLKEYVRRLGEVYEELADGKVMLSYPRLFVVGVRKE